MRATMQLLTRKTYSVCGGGGGGGGASGTSKGQRRAKAPLRTIDGTGGLSSVPLRKVAAARM